MKKELTVKEVSKKEVKKAKEKNLENAIKIDKIVRSNKLSANESAMVINAANQISAIKNTERMYLDGELNHSYMLGRVAYNFEEQKQGVIIGLYLGNKLKNGSKPIRFKVQVIDEVNNLAVKESDWNIDKVNILS